MGFTVLHMRRIQAAGKLDEWCKDNIEWLQDTFGKDNIVSAVLHLDEKTPHIHATVVPIVTGERRKKHKKKEDGKQEQDNKPERDKLAKRQYRKKSADSIRALLFGKTLSGNSAKFYSPEHKQRFEAKDIQLKIEKEPENPEKLRLSLNGQNILDWFKQKYQEVKQATNYYKRPGTKPEEGKSKGIKM